MDCAEYSSGSKVYNYLLLRKRPTYLRVDVVPVFFSAFAIYYNFGSKVFDREELVPVLTMVAAIMVHALMFFVNFWSADLNVMIAYSKLSADDIKTCTHVWVKVHNKKQDTIKRHITPLVPASHAVGTGNLHTVHSIELLKKRMLWNQAKKTFQSIPYPTKDCIEDYKTAAGLQDMKEIDKADLVWGKNKMHIPVPKFLDLY